MSRRPKNAGEQKTPNVTENLAEQPPATTEEQQSDPKAGEAKPTSPKPPPAGQLKKGDTEEHKPSFLADIQYYWEYAWQHPVRASLLGALIFCVVVLLAIVALWQDRAKEFICSNLPVCPAPPRPEEVRMSVSSGVERCRSGHLYFKLRHIPQNLAWGPGTETLLICADGEVEALPAGLLKAFAERFPRCLTLSGKDGKGVAELNYASSAVCRAPFTINGPEIVPATHDKGINLCLSERQTATLSGETTSFLVGDKDGEEIFACDPDAINAYGF